MNYQISAKVTLGLGVTVGQLYVNEQSQVVVTNLTSTNSFITTKVLPQTYAGPTLRASYRTNEKTDISLTLGAEYRTYDDGSSEFGPVFALTGSYRPFEGTSFTLEAHRREQNSAVISGANYISTGASLSARQRFRDRLFGTLTASYDNADYVPTSRSAHTTRNDDYFLLRPGLEAIFGRSWTVGIFYQFRQDISSEEGYSFVNNQVGIQAAWGY